MKKVILHFVLLLFVFALFSLPYTKTETQKTTMKIKLVSVLVKNPVDAFKFYTEVLGFQEKMYVPEAYLAIVVSPEDPDGTQLLLEPNDHPIAKTYQEGIYKEGLPVIIFEVEDIQKEYERLKALGVVFKKKPTKQEWGIEAVFDDTCGNYIQLLQTEN